MYDFSKIKNKRGLPEFKHSVFKKGNFKALSTLKRKVNKNVKKK